MRLGSFLIHLLVYKTKSVETFDAVPIQLKDLLCKCTQTLFHHHVLRLCRQSNPMQ